MQEREDATARGKLKAIAAADKMAGTVSSKEGKKFGDDDGMFATTRRGQKVNGMGGNERSWHKAGAGGARLKPDGGASESTALDCAEKLAVGRLVECLSV